MDAAARLGMEAELYAQKKEIKRSKECYNEASQLILEQMAYFKQKAQFDEVAYNFMKVTADDYRRRAKLLDLREQNGIDTVKQKLSQLKKAHRDKEMAMLKAKKEGKSIEEV